MGYLEYKYWSWLTATRRHGIERTQWLLETLKSCPIVKQSLSRFFSKYEAIQGNIYSKSRPFEARTLRASRDFPQPRAPHSDKISFKLDRGFYTPIKSL